MALAVGDMILKEVQGSNRRGTSYRRNHRAMRLGTINRRMY